MLSFLAPTGRQPVVGLGLAQDIRAGADGDSHRWSVALAKRLTYMHQQY